MAPVAGLVSSRVPVETDDEAQEHFYRNGWTDGLPIVPPTEEPVAAMVAGSDLAPGQLIVRVTPSGGEATVEKIAVNAVMAGCLPQHMPAVIAALRALVETPFNLHAIQTTTNPTSPLLIFNGPIRRELEINCGTNCLGQGARANAVIGRAVRLIMVNLGGAGPGDVDKATHGMPGKYTFCFGENEEESPWPPLHVERGFAPTDSVVTVTAPQGTMSIAPGSTRDLDDMLYTLAMSITTMGVNTFRKGQGEPLLVMCPGHAQALHKAGYAKDDVKRTLHQRAVVPLAMLSKNVRRQRFEHEPEVDPVPIVPRWEQIMIVVAGGAGGLHDTFMPTFGDTLSVSRRIG